MCSLFCDLLYILTVEEMSHYAMNILMQYYHLT